MGLTYDVHTHVGLDTGFYLRGWWPYAATARDLLVQMDAHGIDRAVVFPFTLPSAFDVDEFAERSQVTLRPGRAPFDRENALLTQELERVDARRRLLQFAMFDPSREIAGQVEAIKPLIGRIRGLKTQSTVIRSPVRALLDSGKPLMELAQEHDLPVLFHTSVNDPWAHVADCLAVAEAFPSVRFNLAHSCRFHAPLLREAARRPNVWVDCSAHLAHCQLARDNSPVVAPPGDRVDADYTNPANALEAVHAILGDRYMWGSDNPFMSWYDDKLRIQYSYADEAAVLKDLPERIRASMLTTAPQSWLFGPLEAVIFDMDGVLCDSEPFICEAAIAMFKETYGLTVRKEDFIPFVGAGEDRYVGGVGEKYGIAMTMPRDKLRTYEIYLQIIKGRLKALPGVIDFIAACRRRGLKIAVATAADEIKLRGNLAEIGVPCETFNAIVTGDDVQRKKPDPQVFLLAASRLGVKPHRSIVVEDAPNGIRAARAAGARCLGLSTSFKPATLLENGADWVAADLSAVPDAILRDAPAATASPGGR